MSDHLDDHTHDHDQQAPRRTVLKVAGLTVLAGGSVATLGACAADREAARSQTSTAPSSTAPSSSAPSSSGPSAEETSSAPEQTEQAPDGPNVATADVPVDGGIILDDADYVITQPSKGEFKAFSKICTHQGCPVSDVADKKIHCNCHQSYFSIEDGSVVGGPAQKPLPEAKTTVFQKKVYVTD